MASRNNVSLDRRSLLRTLGAGGIVGLAGCTGGNDDTTTTASDSGEGGGGDSTATPAEDLGNTLVGPDGEQVSLSMVYSTGSETTKTIAQFMKQEYGKMGIGVELTGVPFNTMLSKYAQNTYKPEDGEERSSFNAGPRDKATSQEQWDLMLGIGFNSYPRTPTSIRPFWTSEKKRKQSTVNFYGYRPSEDIAGMLDEASQETDEAKRQELLANVFGVLSHDQPVNFYEFSVDLNGFQKDVQGIKPGQSIGYNYQQYFRGDSGGSGSMSGGYSYGAGTDAKTLNPIRINDESSSDRLALTLDGAYSFDNNNEIVYRWVKSIDTDDKQNYEFTLRDNLQWGGDYGQMTADDWVYYIKEVHQAEDNWAGDVNQSDWFRGEEPIPVEKTGKLSFEIQLPEVDPAFIKKPIMWGAMCLPKGLVEKYHDMDDGGNKLNQSTAIQEITYSGNLGPYTFERWDRESVFVAKRNENYYLRDAEDYDGTPNFEEYKFQVFGEQSTRLSAFETGEIDQLMLPSSKAKKFEDLSSTKVIQTPNAFCSILAYNQRANGWDQLRTREVRKALSMGVNKKTIVENIDRGYAKVAHTHQPEYSNWFDDSKVEKTGIGENYSAAKAKQMLADNLSGDYKFE
ncbi:dipeptide/oligopeptide/nickel ABC transporter periplasmic substrate-binding protein [Haloferax elongans ATCC BAA-1513]|uniref:Dipeptide/oligopeptide/nickel ABC transporter periplasmic substrate-binding protein n=1 Tax=Haloferax elongans ATCC BAA-1513 TaxID=1230453 RepID=M0HPI2_HALEO|nr:ABC transporter substrate-binding protein [Haloferax elongans]ELZ85673.1 dipeptide/oligopeptide/nickel ABC transporter periplasmic substrate-binding protein [Haloferax elongans ATCC BAA-1513]